MLEHAVDRSLSSDGCGVEDVEAELAQLAADGGPLRREVARIAGRFMACEAWARLGFARPGDYGRERVGLSARELLDLARVDGKLAGLPRIEREHVAGRLGWTAVRLLCRVATVADEADWIARAARMSTRELELRVRAVERDALDGVAAAFAFADSEPEEDGALERLRIPCAEYVPAKWGGVRRLLRRVTGEWLSWSVVAEYVAAEVMSGLPLEVEPSVAGETVVPAAERASEVMPRSPRAGPGLRGAARASSSPFLAGLRAGLGDADAFELDRRLCRAVALERGLLCRMGPLLAAIADAKAYRSLGLRSLDAYARERLGMAPRKARALLRVERACRSSAVLRRAWQRGEISWSQAQALVAVIAAPGSRVWHEAWIARAAAVSVRRLEDDVDHALERGDFDPARLPALPDLGIESSLDEVPPGVQTRARPTHWRERRRIAICASPEVVRLFRACLATVQLRLERTRGHPVTAGEALEAMCDHVREVWTGPERRLPAWEQKARRVYERDGWRCVVPGCRSYRNLHAHHIRFRSRGGSDAPENLVTLCAAHHARGVHAGRIAIHGSAPNRLRFQLPLGTWRSGDVRC